MPSVDVVFDVPGWIADGLKNESLKRVGGVITDKQGRVRAWLQEGAPISSESSSPQLLKQLSQLGITPELMIGLQVANLAVSIAGFVVIYKKLGQIQRQLSQISKDLSWLDYKQFEVQNSKLLAAVNTMSEYPLMQNKEAARIMIIDSDRRLDECSRYFHSILTKGLEDDFRARSLELLSCYKSWVLAATSRINIKYLQGEINLAHKLAKDLRSLHKEFGQTLIFKLDNGIPTDFMEGSTLCILRDHALHAHEIIRGHAYQMEHLCKFPNQALGWDRHHKQRDLQRLEIHIPLYG